MAVVAIAANEDDGYWQPASNFTYLLPRIYIGPGAGTPGPHGWLRFTGISGLTQGVTVDSAALRLHGYGTGEDGGATDIEIKARKTSAAGQPASAAALDGYTWTTAVLAENGVTLGTGWHSFDVAAVLQELADDGIDPSTLLFGVFGVGGSYVVAEAKDEGGSFPADLTYSISAGSTTITLPQINGGAALNAPAVRLAVALSTIGSAASIGAPAAVRQNVTTATITASATLTVPALTLSVVLATVSSGSQLFAPSVAAEQTVTTAHIASTTALTAPTVTLRVVLAHIASGAQLNTPTVQQRVSLVYIAPVAVVYPPAAAGLLAVLLPFIGSAAVLYPPGLRALVSLRAFGLHEEALRSRGLHTTAERTTALHEAALHRKGLS